MKSATEHGMEGVGKVTINWKTILDRKNGIITKHVKGLDFLMRKNKVTTVEGYRPADGRGQRGRPLRLRGRQPMAKRKPCWRKM